jgi:hypothetical protein
MLNVIKNVKPKKQTKMKKLHITKIGLVVMLAFAVSSCEKWIDPAINIDPNNPADVTMNLLLAPAQADLAYQFGGDFSYPAWMWTQQMSGVNRQSLTYDRYNYTESDVNNVWRWGMYSDPMMNLQIIIRKAEETESPHYAGVAKVLTAYALMNMTDVWNDIPYSEAFQGADNLKPKFDKQEDIYATIKTLLDEAILDLASTTNKIPLKGDMIYANSTAKWLKAAYSLHCRRALHLSVRNGYADVLTALNDAQTKGFAANADDLEFKFGTTALSSHPLFQFIEQRDDQALSKYVVNALTATTDPRLPVYVAKDGSNNYSGSGPGEGVSAASRPGTYFASRNSPVPFMSYVELLFIGAEALFQTSNAAGAALAYNAGVAASLQKYGVTDAAWLAANANETAGTITLKKIMEAKYLALYLQFETFNDFRRHNNIYGLLPAQNNVTNGVLPTRYPYPTSERSYNGANLPAYTNPTQPLLDKVWWDNN